MAQAKKKKSSALTWVMILGGICILIIVISLFTRKKEIIEVYVEPVEKRTILASVSEAGTVQPKLEVKVAPDVSGEVVDLRFHEGDFVKKGDLLVTIRPDNYKSALAQAQASLNSSQANHMQSKASLAQARVKFMQDSANFKRNDELFKQKVVSKSEWESFRLQFEISKSQVDAANEQVMAAWYQTQSSSASLDQAKQNLNRTSIYASMDGIITKQNVELGERVVGTMQMQGTEMLRIADLSIMEVSVDINENDVISLRVGDSARVEIDAFREELFKGRVAEIAYSATQSLSGTTDQITNFQVKIEIDPTSYMNNPSLMRGLNEKQSPFRPGMSARVKVFTERKDDVIAVPIGAVTIRKKEGANKAVKKPVEIVYVFENGKAKEVEVKTGTSDDDFIEIKEGLSGKESIITGPYLVLTKSVRDNVEVTVKEDKDKKTQNKRETDIRPDKQEEEEDN